MGKASIVYVIGLSVMLAYALVNISAVATSTVDNFTSYYGRTMAHDIAVTGANIGTQSVLFNSAYNTNLLNQTYAGGTFDMHVDRPGGDSVWIRSYSQYELSNETIRDTVIACLRFTSFGKYGWFTDAEKNGYAGSPYFGASDWKITGDSVFGFAHTNGHFNLGGVPYFNDKVTATTAPTLMKVNGVSAPIYKSGYQWGISVNRPTTSFTRLSNTAALGGDEITSGDVSLTFMNDKVAVKRPPTTGVLENDTVSVAAVAPNGVIAVTAGDVHLKGTYTGKLTVASTTGNVWLDGNGIVAHDNPATNPNSGDMLGIVAYKNVYITKDVTRNSSSVFNIQAAVYCQTGELTAESFWTIPKSGRVVLFGGVTQATAGSLGVFNSSGLTNGFFYSIRHDGRYNFTAPPAYPISDKYELVTWWEN